MNIDTDTTDKPVFVVNLVKMYKHGQQLCEVIKNDRNYPIKTPNEVVQTLSDIYWVHKALSHGLHYHG